MRTIIYIILIAMTFISGIFALTGSSQESRKTPSTESEKNVLKDLFSVGTKVTESKSNLCSRIIALAVYLISIASLITLYIIKG